MGNVVGDDTTVDGGNVCFEVSETGERLIDENQLTGGRSSVEGVVAQPRMQAAAVACMSSSFANANRFLPRQVSI